MDLDDLRYQWFDQIFRRGPWPAFVKGRVNVQLAGANDWLPGTTLESLANGSMRYYLDPQDLDPPTPKATGKMPPASGGRYRLLPRRSARKQTDDPAGEARRSQRFGLDSATASLIVKVLERA